MSFIFYNLIIVPFFFIGGPILFMYFSHRGLLDKYFRERLGVIRNMPDKGSRKRILIHAVSVGEIKVALAIIREIKALGANYSIVVSTTTRMGRQDALRYMPDDIFIVYNPIDIPWCVRGFLGKTCPDIFINLETEIWPNFLYLCKSHRIPAVVLNGRMSEKSVKRYRQFKPFVKEILSVFELFYMISDLDAQRILSIGADPHRVYVGGNAKYDILLHDATPELSRKIFDIYKIDKSKTVFVAGSTIDGEEEIIIRAYKELVVDEPDLILLIAPRHIERAWKIASILKSYGFDYCLRSRFDNNGHGNKKIIIVDVIGELFGLYSLGNIIFCGGSLVPHGGHNILEAAVWGKVVMYGPSMENFLDAKRIIEDTGAGLRVTDCGELVKKARWIIKNPEDSKRLGEAARDGIVKNLGSAKRQVKAITPFI